MALLEELRGRLRMSLPSAAALVLTNLTTIIIAIVLQMEPSSVVWAYWLESLVVGAFAVLAFIVMAAKSLSHGDRANALPAVEAAAFFCFHYGFFHAGYFVFLYILPWFTPDISNFPDIGILAGILILSHGFSFVRNMLQEPGRMENNKENRERTMMRPYNRIIPMHIAIIVSGFLIMPLLVFISLAGGLEEAGQLSILKLAGLVVFMVIKTLADLFGHVFSYVDGEEI